METRQNKVKNIPRFKSEDDEREFWASNSVLDFPDSFKQVKLDLFKLKPSTTAVTVRLPAFLVDNLKFLANKRDVPYQSLLKIFLAQRVEEELTRIRTN